MSGYETAALSAYAISIITAFLGNSPIVAAGAFICAGLMAIASAIHSKCTTPN